MVRRVFLAVAVMLPLAPVVGRAAPPGTSVPLLGASAQALSGALREVLIHTIPNPLYEASPGWGHTRDVAHAVHWEKRRVLLKPHIVKTPRNDGVWRKIRVTAQNLNNTFVFELRNFDSPEPLRLTFSIFLAFDTDIAFEQQNWEAGLRLHAGSVRARTRVRATLDCEAQMRVEMGKSALPDAVFRLHVRKADVGYDKLLVEHIAGVGGTAAKLIGDACQQVVHQWRPSLERDMLARANAAILKAGDSREIRLSLSDLLNKTWDRKKAGPAR